MELSNLRYTQYDSTRVSTIPQLCSSLQQQSLSIVCTLMHALQQGNLSYGLATSTVKLRLVYYIYLHLARESQLSYVSTHHWLG